nr:immunoglobulin heavy chain junction region [Mus musculus]NSM06065.1 immunoglobulin heavy chain junction region [Mus musculus]
CAREGTGYFDYW